MSEKFADAVGNWQDKLGLTRDAVRQELVARQLAEHLPPPSPTVKVLDVGCGQGTQAIRLAGLGYTVAGVDPSKELLAAAESTASENTDLAGRISFFTGTLESVPEEAGDGFDVVCCHGVLMYLPELEPAIRQLVQLAKPGGLISVLTRNRFSIAMRAGMTGDWAGAAEGFDARSYTNRVGVELVRGDEPDEVINALRTNGAELASWYGVRLFTDHWGDISLPDDFAQLLEAEEQAGRRDPYRQLTSLTHVIAVSGTK
jgi:S-adenosylmethionine-dependent methyltransferase